jgi:hypothetical protein
LFLPVALLVFAHPVPQQPGIVGTWKLEDEQLRSKGPREVIIRPDSSASWGKEHSRWRLLRGNRIMIAVGGEWETYRIRLKGDRLTISEGDLVDPVTLIRVGPATPLPSGVAVPPVPDDRPPRILP